MALKGTTIIELTNVDTGEKEVIEKSNLVTNAVPSALDNPFAWQLKSTYGTYYFAGNILPLCPNLFGGILLYEDVIPEDVNQFYAQSDNKLIGYSSNIVNNKTDIMRGSMNLNESGVLDTNDGYRFVFDFTTAQANGTISAVGLTSKWGGIAGYGSMDFKNTQSPTVFLQSSHTSDAYEAYAYTTLLHYDKDTGIATSMYVSGQNTITVTRIRLHTKNWKLTRSLNLVDTTQIIDTQTIETKTFAGTSVSGNHLYHNLCDGGDGYVWGFEHSGNANGNSSGNATINWIKIKLEDLSFEEGTWEIAGQLYAMGRRTNKVGTVASNRSADQANCVVLDGYLYCFDYKLTGLYRINLSNVTDIKFIEHPDKTVLANYASTSTSRYNYYGFANLIVSGRKVCMCNGYLNGDVIVAHKFSQGFNYDADETLNDGWVDSLDSNYPYRNNSGLCGLDLGVLSLHFTSAGLISSGSSSFTVYARMLLNSPYLATINNLPTPVQKTADKTMKITYIIREEAV